jgi:hypothetical protein
MEQRTRSRRLPLTALLVGVTGLLASAAYAQRIWVGGGGFSRERPKWATTGSFDGSWNYCRG